MNGLQSSDGKGRKWTSNDTDCQAGTVWRCDMDGTNLELIAHNFRNNYECCVDSFGDIWSRDNDDDGNQQTRICYVMPGGNYGYHPRGPGQTHWHEEQPGIVHKMLRTGFGSPTGICVLRRHAAARRSTAAQLLHMRRRPARGPLLPPASRRAPATSWTRRTWSRAATTGSGRQRRLRRPGRQRLRGRLVRPRRRRPRHGRPDRGRIYRVTPKGHKGYKVPEVKLDTNEGVLAALGRRTSRPLAWRYASMLRTLTDEDAFDGFLRRRTRVKSTRRC